MDTRVEGVGDVIEKSFLAKFGFYPAHNADGTCGCEDLKLRMNRYGPALCRMHSIELGKDFRTSAVNWKNITGSKVIIPPAAAFTALIIAVSYEVDRRREVARRKQLKGESL